ncbi:MAG: hypothetical protein NVS1B9_09000 [Solirubrobacteraceae bacterium]
MIRAARTSDRARLAGLSQLDSAAALGERDVLVAEVGGRLLAALSLTDGRLLADPFEPTLAMQQLLRTRARQLRARSATRHTLGLRLRSALLRHALRTSAD